MRTAVRRRPGIGYRIAAGLLATLTGLLVFWLATDLFPYHSTNDDEGVYLLQASMLLEGQFQLYAGELAESFRPWFFVEDDGRLYPKYAPVPAAIFAIGTVLGEPRISLGLVAAGNVALLSALVAAAWDRRTALLAALALVGSPMFLLASSVFLPYAPTTLLNLAFAFAYVRAVRRESVAYAALAGATIGLAFFGRPYTAVLFAAPFICHACWVIVGGVRRSRARRETNSVSVSVSVSNSNSNSRSRSKSTFRSRIVPLVTVAAVGLIGVGVALLYNRAVTGSALVFPYEGFAPLDGPGFGRREILGHSIDYTPRLAVWANAHALWYLFTRWIVLGPLGAALALVGVAVHARGGRPADIVRLDDATLRWLFVGVACSVVAGNVPFWGTHNMLATVTDPTDGLVSLFGPFYHFDLLLPISGFAAAGVVALGGRLRSLAEGGFPSGVTSRLGIGDSDRDGNSNANHRLARLLVVVLVLASLPVGVAAQAAVLEAPLERNAEETAVREPAYEPFEETDLEGALVFVPTPYGDWLGHPFQPLRNEPDLAGETVYALDRDVESNFEVIDAYPDRDVYRYTYRGGWPPDRVRGVTATLEPLEVRSGERLDSNVAVGVPDHVVGASVTVTNGSDSVRYDVTDAADRDEIATTWTLTPETASVDGPALALEGGERGEGEGEGEGRNGGEIDLPTDGEGTISLLVTLTQGEGSTLTYRLELAVRSDGDRVDVVWPAKTRVCTLRTDCGHEGTYLADHPDEHLEGVWIETSPSVERPE
ncbi:ArnT family glycosyltransferase [Halomontanus rarus]|uniref:ArnT family glycosyltransferase n=1 Tax=Halomontanus rarus TaxID=3034020 RepID=UPI0023E7F878|nr:glycosyltransferase family 39 protein [Halovivax sp. TS33]